MPTQLMLFQYLGTCPGIAGPDYTLAPGDFSDLRLLFDNVGGKNIGLSCSIGDESEVKYGLSRENDKPARGSGKATFREDEFQGSSGTSRECRYHTY